MCSVERSEKENFFNAKPLNQRMVSMLLQTLQSHISMNIQIFIPVKSSFF